MISHSRPQRPRSFLSAPRIETSGHPLIFEHVRGTRSVVFSHSDLNNVSIYWCWEGPDKRSRILVLTKRIVASWNDNVVFSAKRQRFWSRGFARRTETMSACHHIREIGREFHLPRKLMLSLQKFIRFNFF